MATKSDAGARILLRLPAGLKGRLEVAAAAARRSTNAEIVVRLEASLAEGDPGPVTGRARVGGDLDAAASHSPSASDGRCVHELAEGAPAGWCMRPECKAARG